ncbi:lipolytic enzyme, GDSL family [Wolbachia endosymbiont of Armadillidium vulgare str. wVulC]|nr:lipolytic enzyme, GDSL family [Wolbachia endosymbiont of Armadillidium vulgare str. wVulC]
MGNSKISNITDQFVEGGFRKSIKILLKLIFKGELNIYYNPGWLC